jgi:tRNA(Arg) A34 adenosine deaminase TadA
MEQAINEAYEGINNNHGGPFGSVIVKDGKIIGKGHNMVLQSHDPTMHGEVAAIRDACANLGTHNLQGAVLYTTAYPCPMCMGASLWAGIKKIVYACNVNDTADIGFRDDDFYKAIADGNVNLVNENREDGLKLFSDYEQKNAERY